MGPPRGKLFKRNGSPAHRPRESGVEGHRGHERVPLDISERRSKKNQDMRELKGKAIATSPTNTHRKRKAVEVVSDSSSDEGNETAAAEESEDEQRQYGYILFTMLLWVFTGTIS